MPMYQMTDLFDLLPTGAHDWKVYDGWSDQNLVPVKVRSALTMTDLLAPQSRLWTGNPTNCTSSAPWCEYGGANLDSIMSLHSSSNDPFVAQLPSGYNTGVIRQFLPRINSSVSRENVTASEFPSNCENLPGAFYARYAYTSPSSLIGYYNWSLTACMPANHTFSPWKTMRARQDSSEVLYLNISIEGQGYSNATTGTYRISANTSIGYFELPNYMNNMLPGPLLDDDPEIHCGDDCMPQGFAELLVYLPFPAD